MSQLCHKTFTQSLSAGGTCHVSVDNSPAGDISVACETVSVETQTEPPEPQAQTSKSTKFYVGDSSSDDNDSDADIESATTSTIETQTEEVENQLAIEGLRPPRPLNECVAILNSVV